MYVSYASLFTLFYMIWSFKFLKILLYVVVRRLFPLTVSTHDGLVINMKKEIFLFLIIRMREALKLMLQFVQQIFAFYVIQSLKGRL